MRIRILLFVASACALRAPALVPRRAAIQILADTDAPAAPVNISWREESYAEETVPSVSLTRSRDKSTGTATFRFDRPSVIASMDDVWDNGLITGLWLQDEEGALHSPDLSVTFENGRPSELVAIIVLKSPSEWERFMRFMKRYANANELEFERSPRGEAEDDG